MLPRSLRTPNGKYNMMVVHTRLDAESVAKFYNMPLEEFADLPYEKVVRWRLAKVYGIHQMFYDLGYGSAEDLTPTDMDRILTKLNSTFDLVMVAERYDESLVLLKDLMCWTADDVAYLSINFRKGKPATNKIAPETREKLLQLSYPDAKIYEYFLKVFEKKVEAFGRVRMAKELAAVQDANKRLAEKCVVNEDSPLRAEKGMEWVGVVGRVTVRRDVQDCVDVVRTEHDMLNDVRDRQRLWVERGWRGNLSQVVVSPR
ncbi:hypothetical protein O3P69_009969 [Scylla paramamosain]|uniref:Galactosylceramide sulfotransferase n=1 Tax=Scylla paramamosain TaxID=85552 RepID=A0AAW0SP76_SCYPA